MWRSMIWWGLVFWLAAAGGVPAAESPSRELSEQVWQHLTKGIDELSQNRLSAAEEEFAKVIKLDFDNPFANNNLAAIMEKQGKFADAQAYLKVAATSAADYRQKVETMYLIGGVVAAVRPEKTVAPESQIAEIIAANMQKLAERLGVAASPPRSTPPR